MLVETKRMRATVTMVFVGVWFGCSDSATYDQSDVYDAVSTEGSAETEEDIFSGTPGPGAEQSDMADTSVADTQRFGVDTTPMDTGRFVSDGVFRAPELCGNGILDPNEICDGTAACSSTVGPGFAGIADCVDSCTAWDTTNCRLLGTSLDPAPSCAGLASLGSESGVYYLDGNEASEPIPVYCDLPGGWVLLLSRPVDSIPAPWGTFSEGNVGPPTQRQVRPFLQLQLAPTEVRIQAVAEALIIDRKVAQDGTWEQSGNGVRLPLSDGNYAIFSDQASTGVETFCFVSGVFDSGFKCDGNAGQIQGVGLFDVFTEDDFCNCDSHGWKQDADGCEATLCAPTGLFAVWVR